MVEAPEGGSLEFLFPQIEIIGEKLGNRIRADVNTSDLNLNIKKEICDKIDDIEEGFINEFQGFLCQPFTENDVDKQVSLIEKLKKESPYPPTTRLWRPKVGNAHQQYLMPNVLLLQKRKNKIEELVIRKEHIVHDLHRQLGTSRRQIESLSKGLNNLIEKNEKLKGTLLKLN